MTGIKDRTLLSLTFLHALMHIMATTLPALSPLVKEEFQLNNTYVGVLSFAFAMATGAGSIISGFLADRYNSNSLRLVSYGFFGTALFVALLFLARNFLAISAVFISMGFMLSLYHPSALSYISNTIQLRRGRAFGLHEIGGSIGLAIAPLAAGIISLYHNWRFAYLFWVFPMLFFTLLLRTINDDHSPHPHHQHPIKLFTMRTLRQDAVVLMRIYLIEGLFGFIIGGALTFIPIFLNEYKGVGAQFAVILACVFTGGGAIGKFLGGHFSDIIGERRVMAAGFFIIAPMFFMAPLLPLFWCILTLALAGMIFPAVLPAILTTISKVVEPSQRGMAFGLLMFAGFGFGSTSRIILGVVSDTFGISTVFYPIVIAALAGGFLNIWKV
ncbi:MAG: hypothetical protein C4B56_00935 [Candidatus Methanophagaceae archaeon]|nr:MAG: hypothetical protein C4B56_00935 [Methanophagales archaeon]